MTARDYLRVIREHWLIVLLVFVNSNCPAYTNCAPAFPALLLVNKREFEKTNFSRNAGMQEQTQYVPTEHFS